MESNKKNVLSIEDVIKSIGLGYDLTSDLSLKFCKYHSKLIAIDHDNLRTVQLPGRVSIPNVPKSINCDKGDRMRLSSDVLSFQQMSEQFNQELSLNGKIPLGHFNSAFEFSGNWQRDAAFTKSLAFDGVSITLYNIALTRVVLTLSDHVKQAVPLSWDPAALARFIHKYGTHVVVGVKIGGTDIIYAHQLYPSPLQLSDVQKKLKDMADELFRGQAGQRSHHVQDIKFMHKRKGGNQKKYLSHNEWCETVLSQPGVISMSFIPITSLLGGINGSGYLTHAIYLYLRYKPPLEELHQFLGFQRPRQWAPVFSELALGPDRKSQTSLKFSFMGRKLYVNTTQVDVGMKPVTGLRLYLEGKKSDCLAIHLQHLSTLPKTFQLVNEANGDVNNASSERKYYKNLRWKNFSHICTAPVESYDDNTVVTGAHFEVGEAGLKNVLFLRLHFCKVANATPMKTAEWDGAPQKSGMISTYIRALFLGPQKPPPPQTSEVNVNFALYPGGPPVPAQSPKLLRFIDTTEMSRGPQNLPGYWVVSGARLYVEKGKISLKVKYSLLTMILPDEETASY